MAIEALTDAEELELADLTGIEFLLPWVICVGEEAAVGRIGRGQNSLCGGVIADYRDHEHIQVVDDAAERILARLDAPGVQRREELLARWEATAPVDAQISGAVWQGFHAAKPSAEIISAALAERAKLLGQSQSQP